MIEYSCDKKKKTIYYRLWDCYNNGTVLPVACKTSQFPPLPLPFSIRQFNISALARHLSLQGVLSVCNVCTGEGHVRNATCAIILL